MSLSKGVNSSHPCVVCMRRWTGSALVQAITETKMSSFWRNFHHWLHWKLSFWQLPVQPVMNISSKWRLFRFSDRLSPVRRQALTRTSFFWFHWFFLPWYCYLSILLIQQLELIMYVVFVKCISNIIDDKSSHSPKMESFILSVVIVLLLHRTAALGWPSLLIREYLWRPFIQIDNCDTSDTLITDDKDGAAPASIRISDSLVSKL